jgi:hypothetical protein
MEGGRIPKKKNSCVQMIQISISTYTHIFLLAAGGAVSTLWSALTTRVGCSLASLHGLHVELSIVYLSKLLDRVGRKRRTANFQCMRVSCMEWTSVYASTRQKGISYFGYTRVWSRARIRGDLQIVFVASWLPVLVSEVSRQTQGRVHGVLCFG